MPLTEHPPDQVAAEIIANPLLAARRLDALREEVEARLADAEAALADAEAALAALGATDTASDYKNSVRLATSAAIADLSSITVADFDGAGQGVTLVAGDRVLVKDTASIDGVEGAHAKRNWLYVVGTVDSGSAPLTRAADANSSTEVTSGATVRVTAGAHAGKVFAISTADPITLDTTAITVALATKASGVSLLDAAEHTTNEDVEAAIAELFGFNKKLIQSGVATLTTGVSAAIAATITANSRIFAFPKVLSGSTLTKFYTAKTADRSVGAPGSFVITAIKTDDTTTSDADGSTLDWFVIG